MSWQNIIKVNKPQGNQLEAVQKLLRGEDMGLNDIFFLNQYFKGLIENDSKYNRDENYEEYSNILELSEKLETVMSNAEDYLIEATKLLEDIGL
tara:strand:- start:30708 stop:30989 length:282 start_codon:yes stop_codon:yes gene_type:complete